MRAYLSFSGEFTDEELRALPQSPGIAGIADAYDIVTDPQTGYTERVRRPQRFALHYSDVLFYTLTDGSRWRVVDIDGVLHRERVQW